MSQEARKEQVWGWRLRMCDLDRLQFLIAKIQKLKNVKNRRGCLGILIMIMDAYPGQINIHKCCKSIPIISDVGKQASTNNPLPHGALVQDSMMTAWRMFSTSIPITMSTTPLGPSLTVHLWLGVSRGEEFLWGVRCHPQLRFERGSRRG